MTKPRMTMKVMRITPKLAAQWLKRKDKNRPLSMHVARRYAMDIESGDWQLNGDAIRFDSDGQLIDGQHRLQAILIAGVSMTSYVLTGLQPLAFDTLDQSKPRSVGDVFARHKLPNYAILAGALRLVFAYEHGIAVSSLHNKRSFRPPHAMEVLSRHPGLSESCHVIGIRSKEFTGMIPVSQAAFVHYYGAKEDRELADAFWISIAFGENLTRSMPAYHLRERLLASRLDVNSRMKQRNISAMAIKAWNAALLGKRMKQLRWATAEPFPVFAKKDSKR